MTKLLCSAPLMFTLMVSIASLQACKEKAPTSDVKSLDNFVGASHRQNKCMANPNKTFNPSDYPLAGKISFLGESAAEMDAPLLSLVRNAVVNVPKPVQDLFDKMGGRIVVADDAAATCKDLAIALNPEAGKAKDLGEMSSCLVTMPATKDHERILHAHFSSAIGEVHHNAMRIFGSFLTDVAPAAAPGASTRVNSLMDEVARSLVIDIAKSPVLSFDSLSYFLSASDVVKVKQRIAANENLTKDSLFAGLELSSSNSSIERQFRKMAFIEAFDSFYCNDWSPADLSTLNDILAKRAPLSKLSDISNTKLIMQRLFPRTFATFSTGINPVMSALANTSSGLTGSEASAMAGNGSNSGFGLVGSQSGKETEAQGFSLSNDGYQSPAWAGTKAFFGSIWDSTGGAAGRGYTTYSNHVQSGINKALDGGSSVPGALFKGTVSGISDTYTKEVAAPIAARTDRVFQQQLDGNGGNINQAFRNTLAVELLRPTGATAIAETTMVGSRFDGSQYKDGTQRASEFFGGVGAMAGTAAAGVSMVPGLGNTVVGGGTRVGAVGVAATTEEAAINSRLLSQIGVPEKYAAQYGSAFEGGAKVSTIPQGTTLYRTGNGAGSWVTRTPVADAVNGLALPAASEATGASVSKFVTTRPIQALEGGVAPQPSWATAGNPKMGGANQLYIPREQVLSGGMRAAADNAILGGTGAGIATGSSLPSRTTSAPASVPVKSGTSTSTGGFK